MLLLDLLMGWMKLAGVDWENNHVVVHVFDVVTQD